MKIGKCDMCGVDTMSDGIARPDEAGMKWYLICDTCAIDQLKWFDNDGNLTAMGKNMQKAGWLREICCG